MWAWCSAITTTLASGHMNLSVLEDLHIPTTLVDGGSLNRDGGVEKHDYWIFAVCTCVYEQGSQCHQHN